MHLEHIAKGRYILDLTDTEEKDLTTIALAFYKTNRSACLRKIIEGGIAVYNDLIEQGFKDDNQFKESLKIIQEELIGDNGSIEQERKCGSVIESED